MSPSPILLPDHLVHEVLTFFPVKCLMRLKCVSKSWNTLISDPIFVKLHLQRSLRNKNLLLTYHDHEDRCFVPLPVSRLLDNTPITLSSHPLKYSDCDRVVGSCNGLICFFHHISFMIEFKNVWFRLWNPATGTISDRLGSFHRPRSNVFPRTLGYTFGYDISTDTYKIVAFGRKFMRVFCLTHNVWRDIESLPDKVAIDDHQYNKGVYLDGTLNWFASQFNEYLRVGRYLIISLDLATETRREFLPPPVFGEACDVIDPSIVVLMDCLCFCYNFRGTHFVVWQMEQFRVEQSWTQLFKISFENLQVESNLSDYHSRLILHPLYLSEDGSTMILASNREDQAIIYNLRDNRVERTRITNQIDWSDRFHVFKIYVESLVPTS